jgi:hypothetical protein
MIACMMRSIPADMPSVNARWNPPPSWTLVCPALFLDISRYALANSELVPVTMHQRHVGCGRER